MEIPRQCDGCCNVVSSLKGCKGGKGGAYCYAYQWNLSTRAAFIDSGWKCPLRGIPRVPKKTEEKKRGREKAEAVAEDKGKAKKVISTEGGGRRRGPGIKKL